MNSCVGRLSSHCWLLAVTVMVSYQSTCQRCLPVCRSNVYHANSLLVLGAHVNSSFASPVSSIYMVSNWAAAGTRTSEERNNKETNSPSLQREGRAACHQTEMWFLYSRTVCQDWVRL